MGMSLEQARNSLEEALRGVRGADINGFAADMVSALKAGGKVLLIGNGGSAADAQHFAAELSCTFEDRGRRALPAIALTTNASAMTAWSNDYSFETAFARQVDALGKKGDVLISITTSGNSPGILRAMEAARKNGVRNLLFSGKGGGAALKLADRAIVIASDSTPRVQECHVFCMHEICAIIDREFAK
jgi:phosphoheptose isomerase